MPPGIAIVTTKRADMAPKKAGGGWSRIVIERADNGGGTVQVFSDSDGGDPFGGKPKMMTFESPASLAQFVQGEITQASAGPDAAPSMPPGPPGTPSPGPEATPESPAVDSADEPDQDDQ